MVQLNDSPQSRQEVADALRAAGCPVDVSGSDWFKEGTFSLSEQPPGRGIQTEKVKRDSGKLLLYKTQLKGFSDLLEAANIVASIHGFFLSEPQYLNETNAKFLERYPLDFREQLSYDWGAATKKGSLEELRLDVERLSIE
jgi:hypothetical protein